MAVVDARYDCAIGHVNKSKLATMNSSACIPTDLPVAYFDLPPFVLGEGDF